MNKTLILDELRNFVSKIDRISLFNHHAMSYENYINLAKVPKKYDEWIIYRIGVLDSEFYINNGVISDSGNKDDLNLLRCLEIVIMEHSDLLKAGFHDNLCNV